MVHEYNPACFIKFEIKYKLILIFLITHFVSRKLVSAKYVDYMEHNPLKVVYRKSLWQVNTCKTN